ncbi:MAG TPA: TlpA disulfide reductase family protein [Candidatus Methylacidiphilales bacterium]|jgi:thiol-disulfide isomerase/thioredoxin|nr:TlpA disulfide reductase family protein [Candidatus Methylacidiphilales bacterium]
MHKSILCVFLLTSGLALGADPAPSAPSPAPAPATTTATDDLSQYKTADALWAHMQDQRHNLSSLMQKHDPAFKNVFLQIWASADAMAKEYPNDPHVWDAKMMVIDTGFLSAGPGIQLDIAPTEEQLLREMAEIAGNKAAPKAMRAAMSVSLIYQALRVANGTAIPTQPRGPDNIAANWEAADAKIVDFEKEFGTYSLDGKSPVIVGLRNRELTMLKMSTDTAQYQALLQKLATDPQPDIAAMANQMAAMEKKLADLQSKPMDLKFTAVDGTAVDLSKMRGKVVLIDFWATWCGPCVRQIPNVVMAYKKYHDQGFEVIGISLDESKAAMLTYTEGHEMVWPQYFDGLRWKNAVSSSFGIEAIPAMWLVGKDGKVITMNAEDDLAGQVAKALAAP